MGEGHTFLEATRATWRGFFMHILSFDGVCYLGDHTCHSSSLVGTILEESWRNEGTTLIFYYLFTHVEVRVVRTLTYFSYFGHDYSLI
jgi:hypothetical protein